MTTDIQSLIAQYQAAETEAREKQIGQTEKAREYLQQILDIYGAEGAYGKGMEMVLESQKRQDVGKATQQGISSGLYGIRNYGAEWESTVGAKARATLEDVRLGRRAQALSGLAGFEASVEYSPPGYGALMQAVSAGSSIPSRPSGSFGGGGSSTGGGLSEQWERDWQQFQGQTRFGNGVATATQGTGTPKYLQKWYRAGFASPEKYEEFIGKSSGNIGKGTPEYQQYLGQMQATQPGAVTATPSEYEKIQKRLKEQYPQYGQFPGGGGGQFSGYGASGSF